MSNRHIYVCMYICGNEFCLLELFNNQILCILTFILESSHFVKIRMTTLPCSEAHTWSWESSTGLLSFFIILDN